jgi:hypothetical protein
MIESPEATGKNPEIKSPAPSRAFSCPNICRAMREM